jgi:NTE family protein
LYDSSPAAPTKWGVALGSGGARGYAHVPLLELIEECGIKPEIITGSSIGSVVGAAYALTADSRMVRKMTTMFVKKNQKKIKELVKMASSTTLTDSLSMARKSTSGKAIVHEDFLYDMIIPIFGDAKFSDTKLKLGIVATDIKKCSTTLITSGYIIDAVCASASVPGTFAPTRLGGTHFVDGGVMCVVPVEQCKELGAQMIIAADVTNKIRKSNFKNSLDLMTYINQLKLERIIQHELTEADYSVRFINLDMDWYRFDQFEQATQSAKKLLEEGLKKELTHD